MRLLGSKLFIEVTYVFHRVLNKKKKIRHFFKYCIFITLISTLRSNSLIDITMLLYQRNFRAAVKLWLLTIVGTNGGFTRLRSKSSHAMCLKNACFLTSSASFSLLPNRLSGFFLSNCYTNDVKYVCIRRTERIM